MNYSVNLSSGQTVEVVIGEAAQINVEQALNYIESGRVEITKYVNEWAKPEITNYTNEYAKPIVTEIVNQTTKPLIDNYLNTTTKPQIDEYVADNVKPYADSAQDSAAKAKISEDNAKTSETNAKASELAAASSAGVASAAAVTATEAKDYTAKVLTDENLKTVGQDLQSADSNIKTVATNIVNVNTVAKNIDNVNLLAPHTEAMETLAPDIMDVVTVAGIAKQTKNVSENMTAVVDVSKNKANIDNVSTNIAAVNNVSENMADVKNAVQSANDAKLWAVGTITEKPEGSSKYWAEQAQQAAQVYDASETVKGIVRLSTSEEAKAGLDDKTAITPLKLKQNIVDNVGRVNQLGFNGVLQSGVITFTPDQGTYELKAGYEYEIDLLFSAVGIIPDDTQLKIVNGTDTINIVNVLDSDYSKPTTYKAMKQVCRYDTEIGWRWIFNVRYSVASDGSKVFVMPSTATNVDTTDIYNKIDTKQDKSTAVNYNNISNCITYIPQDIKLELNNGTLTLKAGSRVYIPNGFETSVEPLYAWPVNNKEIYYTESETPAVGDKTFNEKGIYTGYKVHDVLGTTLTLQKGKDSDSVIEQVTVTRDTSKDTYFSKPDTSKPKFNVVTIESDKIVDYGSKFNDLFLCINSEGNSLLADTNYSFSGQTAPTDTSKRNFWYDTSANIIKTNSPNSTTFLGNLSLPMAIVNCIDNNKFTIDQVFNGFGYIGSTHYALPGVKGLIPNGRNADGSLKNIEFTTTNVAVFTRTYPNDLGKDYYFLYPNNIITDNGNLIIQDHEPSSWNYMVWFDTANNLIKYNDGTTIFKVETVVFASSFYLSGKISSFTPKTVFHALDYNDKSTISGWSMPSNKSIQLTVGAHGTAYTAPANGWFTVSGKPTKDGGYFIMDSGNWEPSYMTSNTTGYFDRGFIPVRKGQVITIYYGDYEIEASRFRFIYAEGEPYNSVSSSGSVINDGPTDAGGDSDTKKYPVGYIPTVG